MWNIHNKKVTILYGDLQERWVRKRDPLVGRYEEDTLKNRYRITESCETFQFKILNDTFNTDTYTDPHTAKQ